MGGVWFSHIRGVVATLYRIQMADFLLYGEAHWELSDAKHRLSGRAVLPILQKYFINAATDDTHRPTHASFIS
jgi:hypothetical protein